MKRSMKRTQNRRKRMTRRRSGGGSLFRGARHGFLKMINPDKYNEVFDENGNRRNPNFTRPKIFAPIFEGFKKMFRRNNE